VGKKPNAEEKRFHLWVMGHGCCVCGSEAVFHHVSQRYPKPRRDHYYGAPLCHEHHSKYHDKFGNVDAFLEAYGVQLEEIAEYYRDKHDEQIFHPQ